MKDSSGAGNVASASARVMRGGAGRLKAAATRAK